MKKNTQDKIEISDNLDDEWNAGEEDSNDCWRCSGMGVIAIKDGQCEVCGACDGTGYEKAYW